MSNNTSTYQLVIEYIWRCSVIWKYDHFYYIITIYVYIYTIYSYNIFKSRRDDTSARLENGTTADGVWHLQRDCVTPSLAQTPEKDLSVDIYFICPGHNIYMYTVSDNNDRYRVFCQIVIIIIIVWLYCNILLFGAHIDTIKVFANTSGFATDFASIINVTGKKKKKN